jgi:hypothetical protein
MIEHYYDSRRRHTKTYCDSCGALLDDTGPGKKKLGWDKKISNTCPYCKGEIHIDIPQNPPKP